MKRSIAGVAALLALSAPAAAAPAPRVSVRGLDQIHAPPHPYDAAADADRAVAAARAQALAGRKRLLIELGGDWCPDCRILAGVMALPEVAAFLDAHYAVVAVDVGRFDRNLQIPARYGLRRRLEGIPSVLVVDPASGRLLNAGHTAALADARSMSPQAIADWLAQWTP